MVCLSNTRLTLTTLRLETYSYSLEMKPGPPNYITLNRVEQVEGKKWKMRFHFKLKYVNLVQTFKWIINSTKNKFLFEIQKIEKKEGKFGNLANNLKSNCFKLINFININWHFISELLKIVLHVCIICISKN